VRVAGKWIYVSDHGPHEGCRIILFIIVVLTLVGGC
jgi:hypothetical protein